MKNMFSSATARLTMYYMAIIAVISIGFSAALYQIAVHDLRLGLERQNRRIYDNFPVFADSPYLNSQAALKESTQHLLSRLVACNILVLTGAGFASYGLARRTLRPIQQAHDRQSQFVADVSHELRTPLTSLKMSADVALLDTNATKPELREVIQSNAEDAERLSGLVQNLLQISRLDRDSSQTPDMQTVDLNEATRDAVDQIEPTAKLRHISIVSKLPSKPVLVQANNVLLKQCISILLENAVKYSPDASTVTISVQSTQGIARVAVVDQGIGIAKDEIAQVFERFYRADQARTTQDTDGFGLGLSIAKQIADIHGAEITLQSSQGKGTTATLAMEVTEITEPIQAPST